MRALALDGAAAAARFGEPAAAWLHALIAEIETADAASELFSLYGASASAASKLLVVNIAPGLVATFVVVGDKDVLDAHGAPVWSVVRRLKLVEVEAYGTSI